jgi:hypothetical protein
VASTVPDAPRLRKSPKVPSSVPAVADVSADRAVLDRMVDRLRSMAETRLTRPDSDLPAGSVAAECHALSVWAARGSGSLVPVPRLHPLASGDQLAVIGRELLDAAERGDARLEPWRERVRRLRGRL